MEILPYEGVGPIRFKMTVHQVRSAMQCEASSFRKPPTAEYETDGFENFSIHVFYRHPGVCQAVEFFRPAVVTYCSRQIIGQPFSQVRDWILKLDPVARIEKAGLTSFQLGIALYAPAIKAPDEPVEAVLVFEKDYYTHKSATL